MWFVIKTFELLGWVKTNPKSLKVFSSLGILSSFSIPSNFVEFFEDNFKYIMDNFRTIWENFVKFINNCLPLVRCVFFRLLPFRRILVGNCCQNLEKGHCKIADPIPELVKLKKIKK